MDEKSAPQNLSDHDKEGRLDQKPDLENISLGNDTILSNGDNNPTIRVTETVGLVMMTAMAFALFFALMRSQARNRKLLEQIFEIKGSS